MLKTNYFEKALDIIDYESLKKVCNVFLKAINDIELDLHIEKDINKTLRNKIEELEKEIEELK